MTKKLLLIACVFVLSFSLKGQDIHFSQYDFSPLSLNPSLTGNFDGDWRVSSNYRNQWKKISQAYTSNSIGYDQQIYYYNEQFSAGGFVLSDKSGDGSLSTTKIYLSGAYHKSIANNNLHFGIQPGYVLKSVDMTKLTFPEQFNWDKGQFDNQMTLSEATPIENLSYFDLNTGIGWDRKFSKFHPAVGLAVFHLTQPKESFFSSAEKLKNRYVVNANARYDASPKIFLVPQFLLMATTKSSEKLLGLKLGYNLAENKIGAKSVFLSSSYRDGFKTMSDAAIVSTGINFKNLDIGFSYDFNISDLHLATNYKGAFEIAVIYTALSTRLKKVRIPCERI